MKLPIKNIKLDPWQLKFLETKGDKVLCCGRQIGKSEICGIDAGEWAVHNANKSILMIAPTERQASGLFNKTLDYLATYYPRLMYPKGKNRPTKTRIILKNGTIIYCLPTGQSGLGVRFLTVHRLYVDEASRVPEEVWTAVTPMLATTGGDEIYLSTPAGPEGYFADVVENRDNAFESFTRFTGIATEKVLREREIYGNWTEEIKERALLKHEREKRRKTAMQYAQEYLGEIVADLRQFFPDRLIKQIMTLNQPVAYRQEFMQFMGVDVAARGRDEFVEFSMQYDGRRIKELFKRISVNLTIPEGARKIIETDMRFNHKLIHIDNAGLGEGTHDILMENSRMAWKTVGLKNAQKSIDAEDRKRKIIKEDLYTNALRLMEQGIVEIVKDDDTFHSLRSVQFEIDDNKNIRIFGTNTHIAEAFVRAVWPLYKKPQRIRFI